LGNKVIPGFPNKNFRKFKIILILKTLNFKVGGEKTFNLSIGIKKFWGGFFDTLKRYFAKIFFEEKV